MEVRPRAKPHTATFLLRELHVFTRTLLQEWRAAVKEWDYLVHETKKKILFKFLFVLLVILSYGWYVIHRFGGKDGAMVTLLTWSFFVFCTPIADAGVLLDFPMRLFTDIRMVKSEIVVWVLGAIINAYALLVMPAIYEKTILLQLLAHIILQPWPYWSIIVLCGIGTFLSIIFADELVDVAEEKYRHIHHKHGHKWELVAMVAVVVLVLILYEVLLKRLGVALPLI